LGGVRQLSRITFTLETDDINAIDSFELNFKNEQDYDLQTSTIYDDEGRPVKIVSTYSYTSGVTDADV